MKFKRRRKDLCYTVFLSFSSLIFSSPYSPLLPLLLHDFLPCLIFIRLLPSKCPDPRNCPCSVFKGLNVLSSNLLVLVSSLWVFLLREVNLDHASKPLVLTFLGIFRNWVSVDRSGQDLAWWNRSYTIRSAQYLLCSLITFLSVRDRTF